MNIPSSASTEIVMNIMGSPTQLQSGLVDYKNEEEMDEMLVGFKNRWSEIEKPYNSPPIFQFGS